MKLLNKSKAQVARVIGGLIVGVVMLFVGLFMVDIVQNATGIDAGGNFAGVQTELIATTSTIFTVLGLVIIVIALATAIQSLRGVTGAAE